MKRIFLLLISAMLMACVGDDRIYREYECYFVFNSSLHPMPCQLTAMLSTNGQFMKIEALTEQGVRHLKTTRNFDGSIEDIRLSTETESKLNYALGANNCIIVGISSFDNVLVAYEGQCSNCLKDLGGRKYPLTWSNNGTQLHCDKCQRTYNVNNGVVANGAPGIELYRYKVGFDGTILRVWN